MDYMEKKEKSNGLVQHSPIYIPFNTPSLKNSKIWTGRRLIPSKSVRDYIKLTEDIYQKNKPYFLELIKNKEKPYKIGFHFIRKSKHKFDFINACQIVQDLMVRNEWLVDDNMDELIPYCFIKDNKGYTYDKDNPGVEIYIL